MKNRRYLIIYTLILLLLPLISSIDEQTMYPCGGDEETIFLCEFGDVQVNHLFAAPIIVQEDKILKIEVIEDIFKFPHYIYCIILPFFIVLLLIILYLKKYKKHK